MGDHRPAAVASPFDDPVYAVLAIGICGDDAPATVVGAAVERWSASTT
ncbi:hypothetical protein [Streptomyces mutabilis]